MPSSTAAGPRSMQAADNGDTEMIKMLLQHGADPVMQNDDGKTPANIAEMKGRTEALKLLSAA